MLILELVKIALNGMVFVYILEHWLGINLFKKLKEQPLVDDSYSYDGEPSPI